VVWTDRAEAGTLAGDRRERIEKVAGRAREPVEAGDHQHVAGVELAEDAAELDALGKNQPPSHPKPATEAQNKSAPDEAGDFNAAGDRHAIVAR
jgi:hypothetical protein